MESNMRMSTVRPTPNPKARAKKDEEDNFLVLPDKVIADCINDLGLEISVDDIRRPQPQTIQRIYEYFVEVAMNVVREVVAPAMKAAAEDISGGHYTEVYSPDTVDLLGLFVNLRKLFSCCGIDDFQLQDLFKPAPDRVVKQCSYVINFLRFRESQQSVISEYVDKAERTKQGVHTLRTDLTTQETTLQHLEHNRRATESLIREKEARSEDLKRRLLDLSRAQDRIMERSERGRKDLATRKSALESKLTHSQKLQQDAEKLRPYATQSRAALETTLDDLKASLSRSKSETEALERRERALQTSIDSFASVTTDVDACTALLQDLSRDLAAEDATLSALSRNRDALSTQSHSVRDVERREAQLTQKLENTRQKTVALREKAEERRGEVARKMEEIMREDDKVRRERAIGEREMERRRARIEQAEKKMLDLGERVQGEVWGARDEYLKLDAHVRLYMKEMGQCIG